MALCFTILIFGIIYGQSHINKFRMVSTDTLKAIGRQISTSMNNIFEPIKYEGSFGGSGFGSTGTIYDKDQNSFFLKSSSLGGYDMLCGEYEGIKEIFLSNTIKVPKPICIGVHQYNSFVVFEKVSMGGYGSPELFVNKLFSMHKVLSRNDMFGWKMNNTIGATHQTNTYSKSWAKFWDEHRLGHMLKLAKRDGAVFKSEDKLRTKVYDMLSRHECIPSLVHGDLWSGNHAFTKDGEPIIYDPAVYYGDREVDIAMTKLFGSNSKSFYSSYERLWPIPNGSEERETIYNLYHILNHYVLFGGGYLQQSYNMIDRILSF